MPERKPIQMKARGLEGTEKIKPCGDHFHLRCFHTAYAGPRRLIPRPELGSAALRRPGPTHRSRQEGSTDFLGGIYQRLVQFFSLSVDVLAACFIYQTPGSHFAGTTGDDGARARRHRGRQSWRRAIGKTHVSKATHAAWAQTQSFIYIRPMTQKKRLLISTQNPLTEGL